MLRKNVTIIINEKIDFEQYISIKIIFITMRRWLDSTKIPTYDLAIATIRDYDPCNILNNDEIISTIKYLLTVCRQSTSRNDRLIINDKMFACLEHNNWFINTYKKFATAVVLKFEEYYIQEGADMQSVLIKYHTVYENARKRVGPPLWNDIN